MHRSATCEVLFATDAARGGQRVAIKVMRNRRQFEAEARASLACCLADCLCCFLPSPAAGCRRRLAAAVAAVAADCMSSPLAAAGARSARERRGHQQRRGGGRAWQASWWQHTNKQALSPPTNARTTHAAGARAFACREPLPCHRRRRRSLARSTGWHTPEGEGFADELGNAEEPEHTPCAAHARFDDYKYVLTMQCAERSLHDACAKERIAGLRVAEIRDAVRSVAACLGALHARGVCHGDCKQRNVVRLGGRWVLCDMDAAARVGERIGEKTSTAYCPPELARRRFTEPV